MYTYYGRVQINTRFVHSHILVHAMQKVHPREMLGTFQMQLQYNDHESHNCFNLLQIVYANCIEVGRRSSGGWQFILKTKNLWVFRGLDF